MKLIIAIFLLSIQLGFSCDVSDTDGMKHCMHYEDAFNFKEIDTLKNSIIENSKLCDDDKFLEEAKFQYSTYRKGKKIISKTIKGKSLKGTPQELEFLNKMLSGRGTRPSTFGPAMKECTTVLCVLEKILSSKESAYRALNISYKSNYHIGLNQIVDEEHIWTKGELRDLNYSVNQLPKSMLNSSSMGRFYTLPKGYGQEGDSDSVGGWAQYGSKKSGEIVFRHHIRTGSPMWRVQVMIHEMAHQHDYDGYKNGYKQDNRLAVKNDFSKLNGWKKTITDKKVGNVIHRSTKWNHKKTGACFAREYAGKSVAEDYAVSIAYYVLKPQELLQKCPQIYDHLKKNEFKGKEYIDTTNEKIMDKLISDSGLSTEQCVVIKKQGLRIKSDKTFHTYEKDGSMMSWTDEKNFTPKLKINKYCMDSLNQKLMSITNEESIKNPLICTNKKSPESLGRPIISAIFATHKKALKEHIETVMSKSQEKRDQCKEEKDYRKDCFSSKIKYELENTLYDLKDFGVDEESSFVATEKEIPKSDYKTKDILINCYNKYNYSMNTIIMKDMYHLCTEVMKDYFADKGYKFDKFYRYKSVVKDISLESFNQSLKEDFLDKLPKNYSQKCFIRSKRCVSKNIKAKLIEPPYNLSKESEQTDQFVETLWNLLDNNRFQD